jgi:carbonic anhydrase/acetyltransferase-like protein (isoleucine patch superfamily)
MSEMHDFGDDNGPVEAHRHPNGGGWVAATADVGQSAFVGPNAAVFVFGKVQDQAMVTDTAWVLGNAQVSGNSRVSGDAEINGSAIVQDRAHVSDNAFVSDNAVIEGDSVVGGSARISGNARLTGTAVVVGVAEIGGDVVISDDLRLSQASALPHQATSLPGQSVPISGSAGPGGPGWWMAADGRWYPPPGPSQVGTESTNPKFSGLAIWSFVLVILLGSLGALAGIPMGFVARSHIKASEGRQRGAGLALAAIIIGFVFIALTGLVILLAVVGSTGTSGNSGDGGIGTPTTLGVGPTLSELTANAKSQITGSGTGNFGAVGVDSVICNPPGSWHPGATFTCYAYDSSNQEVGEYDGTVEPDSGDTYQWNAQWIPS